MEVFRSAVTAKGNINELGSGNLQVGQAPQSGTSLVGPDGSFIQSHCYAFDTLLVIQAVKKHTDNEFFFAGGYYKDACPETGGRRVYPVIGKMDSLGFVLSIHHYVLNAAPCGNIAGDIEVFTSGEVVAWGKESRLFALKTDAMGEVLWAKRFPNHGAFRFIKELPGGDLLAGINMDTAGVVVARMDVTGNILWCKSYIRPSGMIADCVVESDSSFVITGFTDNLATTNSSVPMPVDYDPRLFLMKLNGEGEVQWCRGYRNASTRWYVGSGVRMVQAQDGNYVLLANTGGAEFNRRNRPYLMKTDRNGDTLWTRSNAKPGYTYGTGDLLAYSDGGFIFNGRILGNMPDGTYNWAFLYKADSLGRLPCHDAAYPVLVEDLFPTDSSFTLNSVDGAERRSAFVNDAIFGPIVPYDACDFTGVPEFRVNRFQVRPNPNTGRFTLQFESPLAAKNYYSVYDAMGRLLFQRPLPAGREQEEVDLSRFGSGTYVIKFTDPGGVCHERVVVE